MADNVPLGMEFMRWQSNPGLFDTWNAAKRGNPSAASMAIGAGINALLPEYKNIGQQMQGVPKNSIPPIAAQPVSGAPVIPGAPQISNIPQFGVNQQPDQTSQATYSSNPLFDDDGVINKIIKAATFLGQ